jgi:hypothetical protein
VSIQITQVCDYCGEKRELAQATTDHKKKCGWRLLPVRSQFGESRDEQPWLCPGCLKKVERFIDAGPVKEGS